MNEGKLLKLLASFLIIVQIMGFVFKIQFLNTYTRVLFFVFIVINYFLSTKKTNFFYLFILFVFFVAEMLVFFKVDNEIRLQMIIYVSAYVLLFYVLYSNHKSFVYNKRDVFTLVLGSSLYTVIFILAYSLLRKEMGELYLLGFIHLLLLYILLIVGAMHYINIRSEKSLWFFLSMLNFAFSDFMLLIDTFYLKSYELKVLMLICKPLGLMFLVNYMITKSLRLKSEEFEGF